MPKKKNDGLSYKRAGVDIDAANSLKQNMRKDMETTDPRVLNRVGAFGSLFEASFPGIAHPVLVMKTEEPGSKQKLAIEHKRYGSICLDMIHHLINDIAVMGAVPLAVQDAIICGKLEPEVVTQMVRTMAEACRTFDCTLTGGETSEQPGVIPEGTYILTSSVVGVVEKSLIIDGSRIQKGDQVLAVASNGLHTNGYSLVRRLMKERPAIVDDSVNGESFLDAILTPHLCYLPGIKELCAMQELNGMAHITGGGIAENLDRILPADLDARIHLKEIDILPIFRLIREAGNVSDADMLRTFNLGVGLTIVADRKSISLIESHLAKKGFASNVIGEIVEGKKSVDFSGKLSW